MENKCMGTHPVFERLYVWLMRRQPVRGSNYEYSSATLSRRGDAFLFKKSVELVKNKNSNEIKAYISSDGCPRPRFWNEDLYGIPRIAVHGVDSICVVTRKEDVVSLIHRVRQAEDPTQSCMSNEEYSIHYFHHKFRNAVIYEVEELAVPCVESMERLQSTAEHISMPFAVVSEVPCINSSHQAGVDNAIKFLQEEMNSDAAFTFIKTVKTAVGALQHLFGKKFKANEIEIFVLRSDDGIPKQLVRWRTKELPTISVVKKMQMQYEGEVEEMPIHAERRVKDYLTLINKPT